MKKNEINKINPWEISSPPKFVIQMIPAAQARSATLLISKGRPLAQIHKEENTITTSFEIRRGLYEKRQMKTAWWFFTNPSEKYYPPGK